MEEQPSLGIEQHPSAPDLTPHNPILKWICRVMVAIAAATLGIMLTVSVADVAGRYFFLRPVEGASELVAMMMVVIGFLGLGYTQLIKGNVSIDIFTSRLGSRGRASLNIFSYLMSVAICVVIVWQGGLRAWDYLFRTLGATTTTLGLPYWPFMFLMVISFAWVTLIFVLDLIKAFREVFKRGTS